MWLKQTCFSLFSGVRERGGCPYVWRVGGHPNLALHDEPRAIREALLRLICSLSATVVCDSRFVAARLRGLGAFASRVIYNGVPIPEASPPPPSIGVTVGCRELSRS